MTFRFILQLARSIRATYDCVKENERLLLIIEEALGIIDVHED